MTLSAPYYDDGGVTIHHGDSLEVLRQLPDGIVQTCVTSPPYWGLRTYGTATWEGGDPECEHVKHYVRASPERSELPNPPASWAKRDATVKALPDVCGKCGAKRIDQQLGLEPTPEAFIANMVELFGEVRRILRDDGTLWLNLGDSYAGGGGYSPDSPSNLAGSMSSMGAGAGGAKPKGIRPPDGLKPKDLCGMPWRVALALQADGWYLRSDIIWHKPNPMPESCTDRPTKSHEHIFLMSKKPHYYYDADAVREESEPSGWAKQRARGFDTWDYCRTPERIAATGQTCEGSTLVDGSRNKRDVFSVPTLLCKMRDDLSAEKKQKLVAELLRRGIL